MNITGTATGGNQTSSFGAYNNTPGASTLRVFHAIGGTVEAGVGSVSAVAIATVEQVTFAGNGTSPINGFVRMRRTANNQARFLDENNVLFSLSDTTNVANQFPAIANVRQGVTYASGNMTGTLAVPLPANVRRGFATDNTIGTGEITAADLWNAPLASLTAGIGARLKDVSTVATTGDQLAALL